MRLLLITVALTLLTLGLAAVVAPRTPAPALPTALLGTQGDWIAEARQLGRWRTALNVAQLILPILILTSVIHVTPYTNQLLNRSPNPWLQTALYTMALMVIFILAFLPLDYASFVLRRAYGLSQAPTFFWFTRELLNWALVLAVSLATAEAFFFLVRAAPHTWWLWVAVGYVALTCTLIFAQPYIITPLFYSQTRVEDPVLRARIAELGRRVGVPIDEVYVIDASKEGNEGNAYFTGIGSATRVVIYDTLLQQYPSDEVLVILAHELGHWREHHIWKGVFLSSVLAFLAAGALFVAGNGLWQRLNWPPIADIRSLPYLLLLATVATTLTLPLQNVVSRRWEAAADRIALQATGHPEAIARTFIHLAKQNKTNPTPSRLIEGLFATHPSVGRRVDAALSDHLKP
ncbi:MAG: hypothetical protein NVSMB42_03800 [Herpetosiphon sp.]